MTLCVCWCEANVNLEVNEEECRSGKERRVTLVARQKRGKQGRNQGALICGLKLFMPFSLYGTHFSLCTSQRTLLGLHCSVLPFFPTRTLHFILINLNALSTDILNTPKKNQRNSLIFRNLPHCQPIYTSHSHERKQPYKRMDFTRSQPQPCMQLTKATLPPPQLPFHEQAKL